ncbi:MAG: hypothetical protein F6K19_07195 [Cyanothece sp. SIO1E1]|nr:hypothetical protein [Cyanothece sp. SIO1E1]
MSERDNFAGGFFTGALVGGVVGGIIGVLLTSRLSNETAEADGFNLSEEKPSKKKRPLTSADEQSMEIARRGLEDKIAQLNDAIDDVRQQLGSVNGQPHHHNSEESLTQDS